ncbi:MAG TPA: alpha-L-fucosidase [Vicinamibacterales bacterium]|nr:alpha-L-fucosidase [Vicinamibacterales bacterium]
MSRFAEHLKPIASWRRSRTRGLAVCAGVVCAGAAAHALLFAGQASAPAAPEARLAERIAEIRRVAHAGPFVPEWESLARFRVPEWYQDAKFGIFIHWGVYAVPAFGNEWYPRNMYRRGTPEFEHHVATYGPQSRFGYKDFIPRLTGERFDARDWAALFKAAGARYVVPVAEHHDGFAMYDSDLTRWTAAKMGPRRDVIGELAEAVRREGLVFGLSSHRVEHWWFFDQGRTFDSDVQDPRYQDFYGPAVDQKTSEAGQTPPDRAFLEDWLARCAELVDKYQPQLVWFDWWIAQPPVHPYLREFAAYYYNRGAEWGRGVAINYKKHGGESFPDTAGVLDIERGQLAAARPLFWQTDTSVSKTSWGYVTNHQYKTVDSIVDDLVDIVSKNGALLLNVGPKADGTIPEPEERMLREIGAWLAVNGEAIYGTRPWTVFGEGPTQVIEGPFADDKRKPFTADDIRFTRKGASLYAIALAWPESGVVRIRTLADGSKHLSGGIASVELLGSGAVEWTRDAEGLHIRLPRPPEPRPHAMSFRITSR